MFELVWLPKSEQVSPLFFEIQISPPCRPNQPDFSELNWIILSILPLPPTKYIIINANIIVHVEKKIWYWTSEDIITGLLL